MPASVSDKKVRDVIIEAETKPAEKALTVAGELRTINKPFPSPADWRDKWIYFLMVDRFNNPASPPRHMPHDDDFGEFQGGTIKGIQEKLGYLQSLGAQAIWMTPVLKNCRYLKESYHGYGVQDFLSIDPRFGTEDELIALIDEAHARDMYVIFDVIINHAGDVFEYYIDGRHVHEAPFRESEYEIRWHGKDGTPNPDWKNAPPDIPESVDPDAAIFPSDIRRNEYFRRKGDGLDGRSELHGDFRSLKEFKTEHRVFDAQHGDYYPVRDSLIKIYQYIIARFDIDGLRIDTLKHVERDFSRVFGNAMREFALSIGKKNFFTFGETADSDEKIARYTGRFGNDRDDLMGVDAALDFPLFYALSHVLKGFRSPETLARMYEHRKDLHRGMSGQGVMYSSHGEASRFFVTFLDNHDQHRRFYHSAPPEEHAYDAQVSMGVGCLFTLQGIPCLYYGTEQGLHGMGGSDRSVREALWGKPGAFDTDHPFFRAVREVSSVRAARPALRYGRQYFRQVSGNGSDFGVSTSAPGVIAYSRILNDEEVLVAANTSATHEFSGFVLVDYALNKPGDARSILYSNQGPGARLPGAVTERPGWSVNIRELSGEISHGPARVLPVALKPMEIQIIGKSTAE